MNIENIFKMYFELFPSLILIALKVKMTFEEDRSSTVNNFKVSTGAFGLEEPFHMDFSLFAMRSKWTILVFYVILLYLL